MLTIRDQIEICVNASPYLRDAIANDLVNMSSLARQLQPQLTIDLRKPVTVPAVVMALKRFAEEIDVGAEHVASEQLSNLSLRADLVQLTVTNSERIMPIIGEIMLRSRDHHSSYFVFAHGLFETSIVVSVNLEETVTQWFANERVTSHATGLSALGLQRRRLNQDGPGALHVPMQVLAWQGIEIIDVISTTNELVLIVRDVNVERAISALRPTLRRK